MRTVLVLLTLLVPTSSWAQGKIIVELVRIGTSSDRILLKQGGNLIHNRTISVGKQLVKTIDDLAREVKVVPEELHVAGTVFVRQPKGSFLIVGERPYAQAAQSRLEEIASIYPELSFAYRYGDHIYIPLSVRVGSAELNTVSKTLKLPSKPTASVAEKTATMNRLKNHPEVVGFKVRESGPAK